MNADVARIFEPAEILAFFRSRRKHVLTFAGFGELGYRDETIVRRVAREHLAETPRAELIVNTGTLLRADGHAGIAAVYEVARELAIETTGIHPSIALDHHQTHFVSELVDHAFFVRDDTWGGFIDGAKPSPTLEVLLEVSDELVVIGGGKHAADELQAFLARGKPARFYAAEMDPEASRDWYERGGIRIDDHRGEAERVWERWAQRGITTRKS